MDFVATEPADLDLDVSAETLTNQGLSLIEPATVIAYVSARFEFPDGLFDELVFFQGSKHMVRAASRPLDLPPAPDLDRVGMDFLRIDMATPRLTTSASMTWSRHANINAIDTTPEQCCAFVRRRPIVLDDEQLRNCTGRGFVLIRHRGHGLGVGFLESTRPDDKQLGRIRSMYPRAYSADVKNTSPFGNPS